MYMTKIERLVRKLLETEDVHVCDTCKYMLFASPNNSYVFYVNLILHTSDRCSENGIIMALQSIEKMYAAHKETVNTHNGTSILTLNIAVSDAINETYKLLTFNRYYNCNVMTRLNQKYACPYILENDNATEMYAAEGIALSNIADVVTSTDGKRMYRMCLSDITIKNVATQTGNTLTLVLAAPLLLFIWIC